MRESPAVVPLTDGAAEVSPLAELDDTLLSPDEQAVFVRFSTRQTCEPGSVIIHRGTPGQCLYVVLDGIVELDAGEELPPRYIGANEFFGELALLVSGHRHLVTAMATGPVTLLVVDRTQLSDALQEAPALMLTFMRRALMREVANEKALLRQLRRRETELKAAMENLSQTTSQLSQSEELMRTDELTQIYNRRGLALHLKTNAVQGLRPPQGLLLIDCDHFKQINDVYGHIAGDNVLQGVASVLRSIATPSDLAVRLGGDEFCLLVAETNRLDLQRRADFILNAMRGMAARGGAIPRGCAVSIGASLLVPTERWNYWYHNTDTALYKAKDAGGNCIVWYELDCEDPEWPQGSGGG